MFTDCSYGPDACLQSVVMVQMLVYRLVMVMMLECLQTSYGPDI